jgi:hypothetical protein
MRSLAACFLNPIFSADSYLYNAIVDVYAPRNVEKLTEALEVKFTRPLSLWMFGALCYEGNLKMLGSCVRSRLWTRLILYYIVFFNIDLQISKNFLDM